MSNDICKSGAYWMSGGEPLTESYSTVIESLSNQPLNLTGTPDVDGRQVILLSTTTATPSNLFQLLVRWRREHRVAAALSQLCITASSGVTYTFDGNGSLLIRSDGAACTHDPRNRLRQFTKGGTTALYLYEPAGRRIRKSVNGTGTWFLWDGPFLLAEYDTSGNRTQRYVFLPDKLCAAAS